MGVGNGQRVGIVGLGTIGRIHAERLAELGADLLGADLDADARDSFADAYDVPTFEDHRALLDAAPDALVVGVPNRFHAEIAIDALEAGVPVLVEKPLAHSVESAERLAAAAREADVYCTVGFTMRHYGLTDRLLALRDAGRFGEITRIDLSYLRRDSVPGGGRGWFTDAELAGGGVMMDLGVHVIDLGLTLLGHPPVHEVTGVTRSDFGDYAVEDAAMAVLRCADDRVVTVDTAWRTTAESGTDLRLRGTRAGANAELGGAELTIVTADADEAVDVETFPAGDAHLAEDRAFLEAAAAGRSGPPETVEQALAVQRAIAAIYESARRGEAIAVDG